MIARNLAFLASLFAGALAGVSLDRLIVGFPAWRRVGAPAWAAYSRHADLGNGLLLYPLLAIGHLLLAVAIIVVLHLDGNRSALTAAYTVACLALAGLLITVKAAPFMLRLKRAGDDPAAVEISFRGFLRWSLLRAVPQLLAFPATLWLLVVLHT